MLTKRQTEHIRAALGALEGLTGERWQFARDHLNAVLADSREPDPPATVMPTDREARWLYVAAGRGCETEEHTDDDWHAIADEMRALVAARTAVAAGRTIGWWDCWDREYTATGFARRVRREWRRMQGKG